MAYQRMQTLFEISASDVADTSDDYYTPQWIFDAAGLVFDMDVAAPVDPARRTCPARRYLTPIEDGLTYPWSGLVWMNPPFSRSRPWTERFIMHQNGLALLPAVKGRAWTALLLDASDAIALITTDFVSADGGKLSMPYSLILAGIGDTAVEAISRVAGADKYLNGAYHVRPCRGLPA